MNYLVLDFEFNCKGNNKVVAIGMKYPKSQLSQYFENEFTWHPEWLNNVDILVAHHAPADLLRIWDSPHLQQWLLNGGRIWCTQLAEYLLTGQQHKYPALRDIAVNKYGCSARIKHLDDLLFNKKETLKKLWEELEKIPGASTSERKYELQDMINDIEGYMDVSDLPQDIILEDVTNDVLDTEIVFLQQYKKAKELEMLPLMWNQMDALLSTTEMRFNGWKIDLGILESNRVKLQGQLEIASSKIQELVKPYWSGEFNPNSNDMLSLLFFGGSLKTIEQAPMLDADGNFVYFKTGKNAGQIRLKSREVIIKIKGFGLDVKKYTTPLKKAGYFKVDEATLQDILLVVSGKPQEIIECILTIKDLKKQLSTYYEATKKLISSESNCIHANYNHTATDTGRLSSSAPNMQNQPKSKVSLVRQHFVSRF